MAETPGAPVNSNDVEAISDGLAGMNVNGRQRSTYEIFCGEVDNLTETLDDLKADEISILNEQGTPKDPRYNFDPKLNDDKRARIDKSIKVIVHGINDRFFNSVIAKALNFIMQPLDSLKTRKYLQREFEKAIEESTIRINFFKNNQPDVSFQSFMRFIFEN